MDSWVFGLEADAAGASISHSATVFGITSTEKIDAFGSVTGRVGFAAGPALFYAKGGYGWADNRFSLGLAGFGTVLSDSHVYSGWTVGGGVEYLFLPNWSVKGEYMYADYSNQTYFSSVLPIGLGATFHSVKAGINYHFGGPVVARY